jgi:hypothetical protein
MAFAGAGRSPFTPNDTRAALAGASARARCIVRYEVGGGTAEFVPYAPETIGDAGTSFGVAQLHDSGGLTASEQDGMLHDFYRRGWKDPMNPYQAVAYLDDAPDRGLASHWSPVRLGLCP